MFKRLCATTFVAFMVLGPFAVDAASASPTQTAPIDRTCDDYIPRDLALNVTSAAPGQTVTITGIAYPGDTVTIRIAQFGGPPIILATTVAGIDGRFSTPITIPANFPEGTYNITASSPNCSGVSTITIVVTFPGGRCTDRKLVRARRGDTVDWELLGVLDTTKPLTVTLVPVAGGPSTVVYTGPYPASGHVVFTVPSTLVNGRYRIVESGTGKNGKPLSSRCGRLRVRGGGGGGGTTTTTTPGSTTTTTPGSTTSAPGSTTTTVPGQTCTLESFDPTVKLIDYDGYNPKVEFSPTVAAVLPAGTWNIPSASSYDSYPNRVNVYQGSEVWEIQFLDASNNVLAHSAPTADLPDYVDPGQWTGSLGSVTLPPGVVKVRAHHLPDLYPDGPDGVANSVYPVGFTICTGGGGGGSTTTTTAPTVTTTTTPASTTTTSPTTTTTTTTGSTTTTSAPGSTTTTSAPSSTTTTSTTAPVATSTTSTSTTTSSVPGGGGGGSTTSTTAAPGTTTTTSTPGSGNVVTPTSTPVSVADAQVTRIGSSNPTQVAGESTTRSSGSSGGSGLATTGSTVRPLIAMAVGLIALGSLLALGARRRRED